MYKTILVPHAGTTAGDEALKHAVYVAKENQSKIIILHIVEEIQRPPTLGLAESDRAKLLKSIDEVNHSLEDDMYREMEKKSQYCTENNIEVEIKVTIGDAAEIILRNVDQKEVDLIVMAKRRKLTGVKKLLSLGSVSRKVVENVNCPVMLIDIENL